MLEEKDQYIYVIEKQVDDLRREKENLENIAGRLEMQMYDKEEKRKKKTYKDNRNVQKDLTITRRLSNNINIQKEPRSHPTKKYK